VIRSAVRARFLARSAEPYAHHSKGAFNTHRPTPRGGYLTAFLTSEEDCNHGNATYGFDAQTETYGEMVEASVIDPTKVVRTALQNAAFIASSMLTTEALLSEIPEKEEKPGHPDLPPAVWARECTKSSGQCLVVSR